MCIYYAQMRINDQQLCMQGGKLNDSLGARLEQLITHLKMNQGEFARSLECSPTFISEIVRDIKKPGADFLARIATKFDVSLDWLICGRDVNAESGLIETKVNIDRLKLITLRVALSVHFGEGNTDAKLILDSLLMAGTEPILSANNDLKLALKRQLEMQKFIGSLYNQTADIKDLRELSDIVLKASIERYGLNENDELERLLNS